MYGSLKPFIRKDEIFKLFNLLEEPTYTVLEKYLDIHNWDDELNRLKESRFIGVGISRLLTKISIDYLNCSSTDLINLYEGSNRPGDEPHYEDLIVNFFMGIVTSIIAAMLYNDLFSVEYPQNEKIIDNIWHESLDDINYLFRGRWLRNIYWKKEISREEHDIIRICLKKKYIFKNSLSESESDILHDIELKFQVKAKTHGLDLNQMENSMSEIIELTMENVKLDDYIEDFKDIIEKK